MGQTTKSGRTRNRRKVQPQAPPTGWPPLIVPVYESWNGTNKVTYTFSTPAYEGWPYANQFAGTGVLNCWLQDGDQYLTCTGAIVADKLEVTSPTNLDETLFYILPWQEGFRGMNGEWLAPIVSLLQAP